MANSRALAVLTFIPVLIEERLRRNGKPARALFAMWCMRRRLRWRGWDEAALAPIHPRSAPSTRKDWFEMIDYIVKHAEVSGIGLHKEPLPWNAAARFLLLLVGRATFARVFGQILADMREEHREAVDEGDDAKARNIVLRGHAALLRAALALCVPRWLMTAYHYVVGGA